MASQQLTTRRRVPLDDFGPAAISDALFAMSHLGDRFDRGAFAVRAHSRLSSGLAVLHEAGIVTLRVLHDVTGNVVRDGLITVDVRLRGAA